MFKGCTTLKKYLESNSTKNFVDTGSTLLNKILGGGFACGRIANVFGAESTGKSVLMTACAANFQRQYGGYVIYDDTERTFDEQRGVKLFGLDIDKTLIRNSLTIEDWQEVVTNIIEENAKLKVPVLYIVDSLDALSTVNEMEAETTNMRTNADKSIQLSAFFRKKASPMVDHNITVLVVSQTRTNLSVTFGDKTQIAGGNALKFYCSQRVKLKYMGAIKDKEKFVGITIRAKTVKNKIIEPFYECSFNLYFNRGVDDITSCVDFIRDNTDFIGKKMFEWKGEKYKSKEEFINILRDNETEAKDIKKMASLVWDENYSINPDVLAVNEEEIDA